MVDTIRTIAQVVALLPDNTAREINPRDDREAALSTWGALMARDPDMSDDNANTNGAGFFDSGSRWTNTTTKALWWCFGGTPFAAVWWQVMFFQTFAPGVTSVGLSMPAEFAVAGSPVTSAGTLAVTKATQTANLVYAGPAAGGAAAPTFRALVAADIPALGYGTVTSVGLSAPAEYSVSGSPVTGAGTLTLTKATQTANLVYAGPAAGGAAAPTFRALVAADIPALGYGTVTSVDLTMPSEFTVTGNPVTSAGTLAVAKATQTANLVYAGPAAGGAAAPTFRALVAADIPAGGGVSATLKHNTYTVTTVYADAVTLTDANGLHGCIGLYNSSGAQLQRRWVCIDFLGNTQTGANTNIFAGQVHFFDLETGAASGGGGLTNNGPYTSCKLQVSGLGVAGNNLEIYMSVVGTYSISP